MNIAEIQSLPVNEKLQIMELLWSDLRATFQNSPVPAWQRSLLDARRLAVERGEERVLDWDEIKGSLGRSSDS
jgi:hypothetical protein